MESAFIPLEGSARPRFSAARAGQLPVIDRLHAEMARVMELRQHGEQELRAIRERAMAQNRLAVLGRLAACAAHEICQPLSFLKIFCQTIVKETGPEASLSSAMASEAREACHQIDRIQQLSRQILTFARPEVEPSSPQDVAAAWERTLSLMRPQLRRYNIKMTERRDPGLDPILGNSVLLEQLFVNLLQNSIDAMAKQTEKKIQIRFTQVKRRLVVTFHDNGPGVPAGLQERIFEPFVTTKADGKGTGLGLAIVADIVRYHQGSVRLNGKRKRGAELIIKFPALRE